MRQSTECTLNPLAKLAVVGTTAATLVALGCPIPAQAAVVELPINVTNTFVWPVRFLNAAFMYYPHHFEVKDDANTYVPDAITQLFAAQQCAPNTNATGRYIKHDRLPRFSCLDGLLTADIGAADDYGGMSISDSITECFRKLVYQACALRDQIQAEINAKNLRDYRLIIMGIFGFLAILGLLGVVYYMYRRHCASNNANISTNQHTDRLSSPAQRRIEYSPITDSNGDGQTFIDDKVFQL